MTLNDVKFYLYRSKNKIDMLYSQLDQGDQSNKVKWKVDLKAVSRESETEKRHAELEEKLQSVLDRLDREGQIGTVEDDLPYIRATLSMRWGLYNDSGLRDPAMGTMVYFGFTNDELLFGMAGSSFNVDGMYGLTSTSSRSATPWVVNFLYAGIESGNHPDAFGDLSDGNTQQVYDGIALANHYLRGPEQTLEFVAKQISRERHCRLRPWRDERGLGVLATPLYVAQTTAMSEDDDNDADKLSVQ